MAHELGHAHGLGHASGSGCSQTTTVMTASTNYSSSFSVEPTNCDDEGADRAFPPPPDPPDDEGSGNGDAGCVEGEENVEADGCGSPIIISLFANNFELTNWTDGDLFDLNSDGHPEQLSWTATNSDEAFLVLDRNGNGSVDNGMELFGNFSPQPPSDFPNGFVALSVFDQPLEGGNGDGWISALDEVFAALQLWNDRNHDGVSQPEELSTLEAAGVSAIGLSYRESPRVDRHGNSFRLISTVLLAWNPPRRGPWRRFAVDVFLLTQP